MNNFKIIIVVYNAERWIGKCILSAITQTYPDFDVIVVDDCSTDGTWEAIAHTAEFVNIKAIRNGARHGSGLANIVKGLEFCNLNDIIVTMDGDDWFADTSVLTYLNSIYTDDVWMTYGQYAPLSNKYSNYCKPIKDISSYRRSGEWVSSHLRTFRKRLWNKIDDNDLRLNGEYFTIAWDMAFMYPMLEMAGDHARFIDKVLYIYNDMNPTNDFRVDPKRSMDTARIIQSRDIYTSIIRL